MYRRDGNATGEGYTFSSGEKCTGETGGTTHDGSSTVSSGVGCTGETGGTTDDDSSTVS